MAELGAAVVGGAGVVVVVVVGGEASVVVVVVVVEVLDGGAVVVVVVVGLTSTNPPVSFGKRPGTGTDREPHATTSTTSNPTATLCMITQPARIMHHYATKPGQDVHTMGTTLGTTIGERKDLEWDMGAPEGPL